MTNDALFQHLEAHSKTLAPDGEFMPSAIGTNAAGQDMQYQMNPQAFNSNQGKDALFKSLLPIWCLQHDIRSLVLIQPMWMVAQIAPTIEEARKRSDNDKSLRDLSRHPQRVEGLALVFIDGDGATMQVTQVQRHPQSNPTLAEWSPPMPSAEGRLTVRLVPLLKMKNNDTAENRMALLKTFMDDGMTEDMMAEVWQSLQEAKQPQ